MVVEELRPFWSSDTIIVLGVEYLRWAIFTIGKQYYFKFEMNDKLLFSKTSLSETQKIIKLYYPLVIF